MEAPPAYTEQTNENFQPAVTADYTYMYDKPAPINIVYPPQIQTPTVIQPAIQPVQPMVVVSQPTVTTQVVVPKSANHYMTFSVIMTVLCLFCAILFQFYHVLICTTLAVYFAGLAKESASKGDSASAKTYGGVSIGLNITAIITWVITALAIIIPLAVVFSNLSNASYRSSSGYYYRYRYYTYTYTYYG